MVLLKDLAIGKMASEQIIGAIEKMADPIIWSFEERQANNLQKILREKLMAAATENIPPDIDRRYRRLILRLQWIAMPLLSDTDRQNLLKVFFLGQLKQEDPDLDNTVQHEIQSYLTTIPLIPRNDEREILRKAVEQNKERLGVKGLSEWLADYNKIFPFERRTTISPSEFIAQNQDVQKLKIEEKDLLRRALAIYDQWLRVTHVDSGFQEEEIKKQLLLEKFQKTSLPQQKPMLPGPVIQQTNGELPGTQNYNVKKLTAESEEQQKQSFPENNKSTGPEIEGNTINLRK